MSASEKEKESSQLSSPVHFESRNLAVPALASGSAAPPAGAAAGDAGRGREDAEKPGTPCCAHAGRGGNAGMAVASSPMVAEGSEGFLQGRSHTHSPCATPHPTPLC